MADKTKLQPPRTYRKRKRADDELQTRRRITEAAVALHGSLGPGHTSISAIAERAGVQRATVYRHFPDGESLFEACTAHYYASNPMPDPSTWAELAPGDRLRAALVDLYRWYGETERMLTLAVRDIDLVPAGARAAFLDYFEGVSSVLMEGRREREPARGRVEAAIGLAISFLTWRTLVRDQRLDQEEAVALMMSLVDAASRPGPSRSAPHG